MFKTRLVIQDDGWILQFQRHSVTYTFSLITFHKQTKMIVRANTRGHSVRADHSEVCRISRQPALTRNLGAVCVSGNFGGLGSNPLLAWVCRTTSRLGDEVERSDSRNSCLQVKLQVYPKREQYTRCKLLYYMQLNAYILTCIIPLTAIFQQAQS